MCWHSGCWLSKSNRRASVSPRTPHRRVCWGRRGPEWSPCGVARRRAGSVRPGDLTCQQMIAALFSLTPPFEKSSGFNRKCPRCFDTVAWKPSPPGPAYGHSVALFMWDSRSAKTHFFFPPLVPLCFCCYKRAKIILRQHTCEGWGNKWKKKSNKKTTALCAAAPSLALVTLKLSPRWFCRWWSWPALHQALITSADSLRIGVCGGSPFSWTQPVKANVTGGEVAVRSNHTPDDGWVRARDWQQGYGVRLHGTAPWRRL